jgi:hypothetical protein
MHLCACINVQVPDSCTGASQPVLLFNKYHTQCQVLQLPVNGPSASPYLLAARAIARPAQHVLLQSVDDPTVQQLLQLPIIVAGIVDCAQHTE